MLGWLGVPVTAAITAAIAKQRAVFATVMGLMVYIPLSVTDALSRGGASKAASIFAKSCNFDMDDAFDSTAFAVGVGTGMLSAILVEVLVSIFVARVVSLWLSREDSAALDLHQHVLK